MENYLADKSYLAVKVESVEGLAERPDVFLPLESADVKTEPGLTADRRMRGLAWKSGKLSQGPRAQRGTIKLWGDPTTVGHALNMAIRHDPSVGGGAEDGYVHKFTVDAPNTYTVEIPKGPYAQRFYGLRADQLKLLTDDAKLKVELAVEAMGQFSSSQSAVALTGGASTSIKLKQDYDLRPTDGLCVGDKLTIVKSADGTNEDLTISDVDEDGLTLTISQPVASYSIGDTVYLKRQVPTDIEKLPKPFFFGDALVGFGADGSEALANAADRATATPVHEVSIDYKNNLLKAPTTGSRDPLKILPQVPECQVKVKQLFDGPDQHQKWLALSKQAMAIIFTGEIINPDGPTKNYLTLLFNNIGLIEQAEPLAVGEYIMNDQTFEALYDDGDGQALDVELMNTLPTYGSDESPA